MGTVVVWYLVFTSFKGGMAVIPAYYRSEQSCIAAAEARFEYRGPFVGFMCVPTDMSGAS